MVSNDRFRVLTNLMFRRHGEPCFRVIGVRELLLKFHGIIIMDQHPSMLQAIGKTPKECVDLCFEEATRDCFDVATRGPAPVLFLPAVPFDLNGRATWRDGPVVPVQWNGSAFVEITPAKAIDSMGHDLNLYGAKCRFATLDEVAPQRY